MINTTAREERKQLILDQETRLAKRLARLVLERPTPPIWMIFIPIFFVFHAWRIRQYGASLKTFADNHLLSRRRALEAAASALASGSAVNIEEILAGVTDLPPQGHAPYRRWITLLTEHYSLLLAGRGTSYGALLRHTYGSHDALQRVFLHIDRAEQELRFALIENLDGDHLQLRTAVESIGDHLAALRREELQDTFTP